MKRTNVIKNSDFFFIVIVYWNCSFRCCQTLEIKINVQRHFFYYIYIKKKKKKKKKEKRKLKAIDWLSIIT